MIQAEIFLRPLKIENDLMKVFLCLLFLGDLAFGQGKVSKSEGNQLFVESAFSDGEGYLGISGIINKCCANFPDEDFSSCDIVVYVAQ